MDTCRWFDSHCHFDFDVFSAAHKEIWQACSAAGIGELVIPGIHPQQWLTAESISVSFSGIYRGLGIHPWWIETCGITPAQLATTMACVDFKNVVAIGECGLDAKIDVPLACQQIWLEAQLELALHYALPVILHARRVHHLLYPILKSWQLPHGGVIHGFSGSYQQAKGYWDLGYYLGVGGTITYPRANKTREAIKAMPMASLVLETDAPDMPLNGHQGKPNSPLRLIECGRALATLKGLPVAEVAAITTVNARKLFDLPSALDRASSAAPIAVKPIKGGQ